MSRLRGRSRWLATLLALALAGVLIGVLIWRNGDSVSPAPRRATSESGTPVPGTTLRPAACQDPATKPFTPTTVDFAGIVRAAPVLALPRDGNDVPGVAPLTTAGKQDVAWDRPPGLRPGSPHGNVLLNVHTWPDGSALGNRLLDDLDVGGRITVRNSSDSLCYRVTKRIEVLASDGYAPYYATDGPPQVALIVCSGRRTGPGQWSHRTIWFASPMTATGA